MPIDFFDGQRKVNSWGGRILEFHRSRVARLTLGCCLLLAIYIGLGEAFEHYSGYNLFIRMQDGMVLGAALSVLLVLRTNSAYDRWWEARKSWGILVNNSRNLALKFGVLSSDTGPAKEISAAYLRAFPFVLRDHLRGDIKEETQAMLPEPAPPEVEHLPAWIAKKLFEISKNWRDSGCIKDFDYLVIDQHISSLMDICGVCERIRTSPLPAAHRALTPFLLLIYLISVPVSLDVTASSMLLTFVISYFMIALELIAEEIEEPFGTEPNDIPMDKLCHVIERSIKGISSM